MAIGTAAALIGGSVIGAGASLIGSDRAADAAVSGNQASIAEQRRQFDLIMQSLQPQQQIGSEAINELSRLFGFDTGGGNGIDLGGGQEFLPAGSNGGRGGPRGGNQLFPQPDGTVRIGSGNELIPGGSGDPGGQPTGLDVFQDSPDFQFRRDQGLEGIAQTLGASGQGAFSGNALRSLNEFNSNLAGNEFGSFVNRRLALAGLGQTANQQGLTSGLSTGANVGNSLINQGNARASGIAGGASAIGGSIQDIIEAIIAQNTQNSAIDNELSPIFNDPSLF